MEIVVRYKADQKEQTRKRIVDAAKRSFKKNGFSGIGVDGLAKEAGVTSGAFYGHFNSKEAAFKEAITSGIDELNSAIMQLQQEHGENWWVEFATLYMGQKRTCDLAESCALQSLTPEIGRSNVAIRGLFESELLKVFKLANGEQMVKSSESNIDVTWSRLAMLIGGVTLARAVKDESLSNEIATAVKNEIIAIHKPQ